MNYLPSLLHPRLFVLLSFFLPSPQRVHVEWMRAFTGAILELQEYIKVYHVTGLTWNPDVSFFLLFLSSSLLLPSPSPLLPLSFFHLLSLLPPLLPPSSVYVWFPKVWSIL